MMVVYRKILWLLATISMMALATPTHALARVQTLQEKLRYPAGARLLIIHADDFGMSHSVNRAISRALENGWVTSASVMVPCPWFPEVASWARAHPKADLGIHLVLDSEWADFRWGPVAPTDKVSSLLDPDGYFFNDPSLFTHVRPIEVETELHAQIDKAHAQGIHVSHLDSHMIALSSTRHLFEVFQRLGHEYDLPIALVKHGSYRMPAGVTPPPDALALDKVITMDPGVSKRDWFNWYRKNLTPLKPRIYQLIVHLAYDDEEFRRFLRDQKFVLVNWEQLSNAYKSHVRPRY